MIQSFELRRFPDPRSPAAKALYCYLVLLVLQHWLRGLILIGMLACYWFWRRRRPAPLLRISDAEVVMNAGLLRCFQIPKRQVHEVSPASKGLIIAWKKAGVPHYTHIKSDWFEDAVWRQAGPALLSWAHPG